MDCVVQETEEKLSVSSSELLGLRALHVFGEQDGRHLGDEAFSMQVNSAIQDRQALNEQVMF